MAEFCDDLNLVNPGATFLCQTDTQTDTHTQQQSSKLTEHLVHEQVPIEEDPAVRGCWTELIKCLQQDWQKGALQLPMTLTLPFPNPFLCDRQTDRHTHTHTIEQRSMADAAQGQIER